MKIKYSIIAMLVIVLAGSACVFGEITYTTYMGGVNAAIAAEIEASIAEAVSLYNKYGSFNKHLSIQYNAAVPTADGNYNGTIRFGGQRTPRVALHEIAHTLGVGTYGTWWGLMSGGVWTGSYTTGQVVEFDGPGAVIYADGIHFWLYGLNYETEDNFRDRIRHVRIVANILCDMGLPSFSREPASQVLQAGETAVFEVAAANTINYAWYKDGVLLSNGGGISGATGNTLQITGVQAGDEGYYHCVVSGTVASRPARLSVGHWELYNITDYTLNDVRGSDPYEAGNQFTTGSNPPKVTALGFIDLNNSSPAVGADGDGLLESHRVTLWLDSDGSKVTEVTVPAGTGGELIDSFRYVAIPEGQITLAADTAYVVSASIAVTDAWLNEEYFIPNGYFVDDNVDDSTTWQGRWGTTGQRPDSQWHTGSFYGLANISSEPILRADYDGSGAVDIGDLGIMAQNWLMDVPVYDIAPDGGNSVINLLDFQILSEEWLN